MALDHLVVSVNDPPHIASQKLVDLSYQLVRQLDTSAAFGETARLYREVCDQLTRIGSPPPKEQVASVALRQLWRELGVDNQTDAVAKLRALREFIASELDRG